MLRWIVIIGCLLGLSMPSSANTLRKYASIVVDADTLEVIHARQIDGQRFPASLTKVMTLYLTFDAINAGTLSLNEPLPVSKNAARTPPVDIGLRAGETITVEQAIYALTVRSANDVAVVLAERLAGSEEAFAAQMTAKARTLRMQRTVFKTPHGLPHPDQTTTARDMAKLASAMLTIISVTIIISVRRILRGKIAPIKIPTASSTELTASTGLRPDLPTTQAII